MSIASAPKSCPQCGGPIPEEAPQGLCPKCLLLQAARPTEGTPAKSPPPSREQLAAAFPQLEILELIGQGGMGFVFKARQPKIERWVALKILPQSLAADPAFAERFTREARVLARLNHPNIVTLFDFGQAGGFFFLLMEFVDGVNLRQAMKAGRFSAAQALAIVPKICEALQFAHDEGILHRDIKPENILLDAKGRVKIADFGIAKLMGLDQPDAPRSTLHAPPANLTETGKALGTPHYMAPEQLEHPQDVDQRADIYSLGVVFYEMLTGGLPLGRFAPPSEKSTVDPRVDEVVLRALEQERERRQQSAGEVKTQVETITATSPGVVPPAAASARSIPERRMRCYISTPEHLRTFTGRYLYIYTGLGDLSFDSENLTFVNNADAKATLIPWTSIRELRLGHYSRFAKPARLNYAAVTYASQSGLRTLCFTPAPSGFKPVWETNRHVAECFHAIREAVIARTGAPPPGSEAFLADPPYRGRALGVAALIALGLGVGVMAILLANVLSKHPLGGTSKAQNGKVHFSSATFGPVREQTLSWDDLGLTDCLDLESNTVAKPPYEVDGYSSPAKMPSGVFLVEDAERGDVYLAAFGGMTIAIPRPLTWDSIAASDIMRLVSAQTSLTAMERTARRELPLTFVFRTRHGLAGIMQISEAPGVHSGISARYKLVAQSSTNWVSSVEDGGTGAAVGTKPIPPHAMTLFERQNAAYAHYLAATIAARGTNKTKLSMIEMARTQYASEQVGLELRQLLKDTPAEEPMRRISKWTAAQMSADPNKDRDQWKQAMTQLQIAGFDFAQTLFRFNADSSSPFQRQAAGLHFGPWEEATLLHPSTGRDCFIDFDSGRVLTPPSDVLALMPTKPTPGTNAVDAVMAQMAWLDLQSAAKETNAVVRWILDSGADAVMVTPHQVVLFGSSVTFSQIADPVLNPGWEQRISPAYLLWAFQSGETIKQAMQREPAPAGPLAGAQAYDPSGGGLPSNLCLFKTREGLPGMLQITGSTENPPGVKIRYKLARKRNIPYELARRRVGLDASAAAGSAEKAEAYDPRLALADLRAFGAAFQSAREKVQAQDAGAADALRLAEQAVLAYDRRTANTDLELPGLIMPTLKDAVAKIGVDWTNAGLTLDRLDANDKIGGRGLELRGRLLAQITDDSSAARELLEVKLWQALKFSRPVVFGTFTVLSVTLSDDAHKALVRYVSTTGGLVLETTLTRDEFGRWVGGAPIQPGTEPVPNAAGWYEISVLVPDPQPVAAAKSK